MKELASLMQGLFAGTGVGLLIWWISARADRIDRARSKNPVAQHCVRSDSPPVHGGTKGGLGNAPPQRAYLHYWTQAEAVVVKMGHNHFTIEIANLRAQDRQPVRIPLEIQDGTPPPRIGQALHVDLIVTGIEYPSALS